jgi:hypothetical protein
MLKFTCAWTEVKIDLINRTEAFKAHAKEEVIYGISYGEQSHCTLLASPGFMDTQNNTSLQYVCSLLSRCFSNTGVDWFPKECTCASKYEPTLFEHRVRETFELNQLKSTPSQLLLVFSGFDRLQTYCG